MTRLWWIRHGPTHQKSFVGWRDAQADLSDKEKIKRMTDYLPNEALVVSSDLARAVDTANALQNERLRLPHHPGLREFNFGDWDGLTFSEVADRDPITSRAFWEGDPNVAPPNGESWTQLAERVNSTVSKIMKHAAGLDIIAVAHIGVILTQVARARGQSAADAISQDISPLSVSLLEYSESKWSAVQVNHQL